MSVLSQKPQSRALTAKVDPIVRIERLACPRCGAVNCVRHSALALTTRDVPVHWRGY